MGGLAVKALTVEEWKEKSSSHKNTAIQDSSLIV
jgi:hypothetical protein